MLIVGCSHGKHLASKIANKLKIPYSQLMTKKFPDGELYIRFMKNIRNKDIVFIQSFFGNINDCLIEVLFAANTAKELGARKIILVAPYFPYLRQDKRFHPRECVSGKIVGKLIDQVFNMIYVIDPHLHYEATLSHFFKSKSIKLTSNNLIASYIKKNVKNPVIIGPDWESYKWAGSVSSIIGCKSYILEKKRYSGKKVKISIKKKIDIKGKDIVIVDDIISTGQTLIEAMKTLKKHGAKKIICIATHGIFVENALKKLRNADTKVLTTNTIPNKVAKIDVSELIAENLR